MATAAPTITGVKVENIEFPAVVTPPASTKSYFLGGAGVRGLDIDGEFVKFTGIGIYLEEKAVISLTPKWKGKTPSQLFESLEFYRDIIKGPFEKFIRSTKVRTLEGSEYVRKVSENCIAHMKSEGTYGDAEEKAIQEFREAFKDQFFPPGTAAFYRQSPNGTLGLRFSKDETIPEHEYAVINNKPLSEAVLETMIGEIPVSPALKESLATRFYEFMKIDNFNIRRWSLATRFYEDFMRKAAFMITGVKVEFIEFPAVVTPPSSTKSYFLGGAGVRGLDIDGEFVKFTGLGVYLEEKAVASLTLKWKGKTPSQLFESLDFYRDIIKGPFEKFIRCTKVRTLEGSEYVRKVSENCIARMKFEGTYGDAEEKAIQELREAFKVQFFPPGAGVFFRQSPNGALGLRFSKDETIPEHEYAVINNKPLSEAVLETMIGEIPVSPALKESLATRFYEFMKIDNFNI